MPIDMKALTHVSREERDRLALLRASGMGIRALARELGRAASTISRDLKRKALPRGGYRSDHSEGAYLLRSLLSATTYFCDAYANWQKRDVENTNGRIRRRLPRKTDLGELADANIQGIAITLNLTPRKCLGYITPVETFLKELGKDLQIRFAN